MSMVLDNLRSTGAPKHCQLTVHEMQGVIDVVRAAPMQYQGPLGHVEATRPAGRGGRWVGGGWVVGVDASIFPEGALT